MVDLKQVGERLQSARLWILHAEQSFDKQKDIRGELDLLLAQAELKRVREANQSCRWRYKYSFFCQMAAFFLAVIMVTAGVGGAYWLMKQGGNPKAIPQTVVYNNAGRTQESLIETKTIGQPPLENPAVKHQAVPGLEVAIQPQANQTVSREVQGTAVTAFHEDKPPKDDVAQNKVVSHSEMQKLIHTAGKSLRGQ